MTVNSMTPLFNETQWARRISTERSTNETHVVYSRINENGQSLFRVTECNFHSLEGATWATDTDEWGNRTMKEKAMSPQFLITLKGKLCARHSVEQIERVIHLLYYVIGLSAAYPILK